MATPAAPAVSRQSERRLAVSLDVVREYQAASKAPATTRAYASDWRRFTAWCDDRGLSPLPATPETVSHYLADAAENGYRAATITRWAAAISQAHQAAGHATPTAALEVRACLRGIRRTLGTVGRQAAPITPVTLRRMLRHVSRRNGELRVLRDRALLLVGFASGLRRSELVGLDVEDVEETAEGLILNIRRSKTDQEGQGRRIGVCHGRHHETDPVAALRVWLAASATDAGPIERYSGHSLRAGMATSAAGAGASEAAITAQGGWQSVQMARRYVRDGQIFRVASALGLGL
ncbi:MAG: site-specific integrase [Candidatus Dormiibacterota bacterium]